MTVKGFHDFVIHQMIQLIKSLEKREVIFNWSTLKDMEKFELGIWGD